MESQESESSRIQREGKEAPKGESPPYYLAASFAGERQAGKVYARLQDIVFRADCDLSSYRFQLSRIYHVAVLGDQPDETLERRLRRILASGEPVYLPSEILRVLVERRAEATKQGRWIERHFTPGRPL